MIRQAQWKRKGVRSTDILLDSKATFLQVNDQFVGLLNEALEPEWEVRAVPYIYGVASIPEGPVWIGTSGRGGRLYAIDAKTGKELLHTTVPGGAYERTVIPGSKHVVAWAISDGVALVNAKNLEVTQIKLPGAHSIVGAAERRLVVQSGEPRPGVILLEVP